MVVTEPAGNATPWISILDKHRPDIVSEGLCIFGSGFIAAASATAQRSDANVEMGSVEARARATQGKRQAADR